MYSIVVTLVCCLLCSFAFGKNQSKPLVIYSAYENTQIDRLLKAFEESHHTTLIIEHIDQHNLKNLILRFPKSNQPKPDILLMPSDFLGLVEYAHYGVIPDDWLEKAYRQEVIETITVDEKKLGIPIIQGNHLLLYYNKQFIKQPANTWKAMFSQSDSLPKGVKLINWSFMEPYWFIPFLTAYGEVPLMGNKPNLNTPGMKSALTFVWALANRGVVDPNCDYICSKKRFIESQLAYTINGLWAYQDFKLALGDSLGVIRLPNIETLPMKPYFSTFVFAFPELNEHSPHRKVIEQFAHYVQSETVQKALWEELNELPANQKVLNYLAEKDPDHLSVLMESLEFTTPMPSNKSMAIVWEVLLTGMTQYGDGIIDAEETCQLMQKIAEESID